MNQQAEELHPAGDWVAPAAGHMVPWEDPDLSRLAGLVCTLRDLLLYPGEFFRGLGREGRAEPLAFGLITGTLGVMSSLFWTLLLWVAAARTAAEAAGLPQVFTASSGAMLALMALCPLLILAGLGIGSLCLWGSIAVLGVGSGFTPVWRVYCYTEGVMVLGLIPFLGAPVAAVWVLFLLYQGILTVFSLSPGRTLAVLVIFLVLQTLVWTLLMGSLLVLLTLLGGFALFLG